MQAVFVPLVPPPTRLPLAAIPPQTCHARPPSPLHVQRGGAPAADAAAALPAGRGVVRRRAADARVQPRVRGAAVGGGRVVDAGLGPGGGRGPKVATTSTGSVQQALRRVPRAASAALDPLLLWLCPPSRHTRARVQIMDDKREKEAEKDAQIKALTAALENLGVATGQQLRS
jgi:hypothetical protein